MRRVPPLTGSLAALLSLGSTPLPSQIPPHPRLLQYEHRVLEVPDANTRRFEIRPGTIAFLERDPLFPLFEVTLAFEVGSNHDPPERTGLAVLTGALLSRGGSASLTPAELDSKLEALGVDFRSFVRARSAVVRLSAPTWAAADAIELFFDLVTSPGFDSEMLELTRRTVLEGLARRNEDPLNILEREWTWLMLGRRHPNARAPTSSTITAISRDDIASFYACHWHPGNMVVALSGDLSETVLAQIRRRISDWSAATDGECPAWSTSAAEPPSPRAVPGKRVAFHSAPQAKVRIGHRLDSAPAWTDPERFALVVAREILGGSGAISRLNGRLRTSEGLVYRASAEVALDEPGEEELRIALETRADRAWRAVEIAEQEVERLRRDLVHPRELEVVRQTLIGNLRSEFDTAEEIVGYFAENVLLGRPAGYWTRYLEGIRRVTREDLRAAARKYFRPREFSVLVVGPERQILGSAPNVEEIEVLPERDPRTLEPVRTDG